MHRSPSISVAAVVLTNDAGEVALVRKRNTAAWIFPGGKPEPGEPARDAAVREVREELGAMISHDHLHHVGQYITAAANEASTELRSDVYRAHLPSDQDVRAQAEIAEFVWVQPAELLQPRGYQLAPLSAQVLAELAGGKVLEHTREEVRVPMEMTLAEFETLVGEVLDSLDDEIVGGIENLVFIVEDRPEDGSMDLLGYYEGYDRDARADYGFAQLPDRIVLFREPLLAVCETEEQLRHEVRVTLVHEIAHYYGIDDARLHELGWA